MKNYLLLLSLLLTSFVTFGAKLYVTNTNDTGAGSLRDQISLANTGDTILIDVSGTVMLASQLNIMQDFVIIGPGPIHFSLDGSNLTGLAAMISPGNTGTLHIDGIKFTNGVHHAIGTGSGYSGLISVKNCLFEAINSTAINVDGGNVEFEGCSFIDNVSPNEAGACLFSGNTAKFTNCTFFQNEASFDGGAIQASLGTMEIIHCTFYENGITMGGATNGKALYVNGGVVNIKNNLIIRNAGNGSPNKTIDINVGTLNSLGGNVTTDPNGGEWTNDPTDITSASVVLGNGVTDGWGLKYFPYADNVTQGINIDQTPTGLPLYDQRRVWRVMDDGTGNEFADAGAVEYTPLVVTQAGGSSPGTLEDNFLSVYSGLLGKKAFVFEISGAGPHYCPSGFVVFDLNSQETILNGFSQNGSRVPGPGPSSIAVTSAITPIVINNAQGIPMAGLKVTGNNCVIAGVSIIDYGFGGSGINNDAFFTEIGGCHIGVLENGLTQSSNEIGIDVSEFGSTKIGSGNYCGHLYHSNRNIISGNTNAQIAVSGGEEQDIKHNYIGLASDGISAPIGSPSFSDTGIAFRPYLSVNNPNYIGGYDVTDYNVIGGNNYGISISTEGNFVLNNVIGGTLTGDAISSATENYEGIRLNGSGATNNLIGDVGAGNVIVGNYVGILFSSGANNNEVYGNNIGVSLYGDVALGNIYEGVSLQDAGTSGNKIGGPGKGNVISNNDKGIWISFGATSNVVLDNLVGLSGDGLETNMGNLTLGIEVEGFGTDNNIIGSPGAGNFISFNGGHGIRLRTNQYHTIIQGNIMGLKTDTLTAAGNGNNGIYIDGDASHNLIGGCAPGEGNFIGNNGGHGIQFDFSGADYDTIYGNKIGLDVDFGPAGNIGEGILVTGGAGFLTIGNSSIGCSNEIAYNNSGVIMDNQATSVLISSNSIHDNIGLGIDIDADGTPDYTAADGLTGNEATPIGTVLSCIQCGGNTNFTITPESTGTVTYEVFKTDGAGQEGDSLVYSWTGNVSLGLEENISMPFLLNVSTQLVMTATIGSSTSEFGPMFTVAASPVALSPSISSNSVCTEQVGRPTLSVSGETGTAIWFSDAGLTNRIGSGAPLFPPNSDLATPGVYTYYAVDSVAGCYGVVGSPVTLTVISSPLRPITGTASVCEGVVSELYSVTAVTGAFYNWGFATELPGEFSYNNNIQHNGSGTNVLTTDFSSATNAGVSDTLVISIDSAGCLSNDTIYIDVMDAPFSEGSSGIDPTTCGGSDGQIVTPIGLGTFNFYYNSGTLATVTANGSGDSFITGMSQGVYSIDSISNASGCYLYVTDTVELFDPLPPTISGVTQYDPSTCGGNGLVVIYLTPGSAAGPYTVDLDGGTTIIGSVMNNGDSLVVGGLLDGQVILNPQVTDDATLCLDVFSYSGTISDPLPPLADAGVDQTVCDAQNVTFSGLPSGGGYTYGWNFGDGGTGTNQNENHTYGAAGVYTATLSVTETITGCIGTSDMDVTVTPAPFANADTDITICEGSGPVTLNGMINNAGGGTWTSSGTGSFADPNVLNTVYTPSAFDETNGLVTLTLTTTGNGICVASSDQVDIIINPLPNEGNPFVTDATCFGGSDGSIMIAPLGSYIHSWVGPNSFTSTSQDISGLEAGNYTNTMTDIGTGCIGLYSTNVNQPLSAPTLFGSSTDPSCIGSGDGLISLTSGSGVAPFQFSIDAGVTYVASGTFSGLFAGSYICNMQDANGCVSADSTIVITDPAAVTLSTNLSEDTCSRGVGQIDIFASGGDGGPFVYSFDNGFSFGASSSATGLTANSYDLIVMDGNGCQSSVNNVTINDLNGVQAFVFDYSPSVSCFGSADGFIDISIGSNPFGGELFSWTESTSSFTASTEDVAALASGDYQVVVTDAGGCTDTVPVLITEPLALAASYGSTHETCAGISDGSLFVQNISGGTGPYTTDWQTNPGGTSVGVADSLLNVSIGDYIGITTDANGCSTNGIVDVQIGESFVPSIGTTSVMDSCINSNAYDFSDANGVPASGAANFNWTFAAGTPSISNVQNPSSISFNSIGSHLVAYSVTSNNGCLFVDSLIVNIYDTASVMLTPSDISCFGLTDGIVYAQGSGGTAPYQYSYNGGALTPVDSIAGLGVQTVNVYIVDANGCQTSVYSVGIAEPNQIIFTANISDATCGQSNGQVDFQGISGGVSPYNYSVDGSTFLSSNPITSLSPGTYTFYIMDANGCVEAQNSNTIGNVGNTVPAPSIDQSGPITLCEEASGVYLDLTATSNDVATGTFSWFVGSPTSGAGNGASFNINSSNVGSQMIYLSESNGSCTSGLDSVYIDFIANDLTLGAGGQFCLGETVYLDATGSGSITWVNANGEIADTLAGSTSANPISDSTVYYSEMDFNGCIFTDSIVFTLNPNCLNEDITVNAFSPDGDGVNDNYLFDVPLLLQNDNQVKIFNRWGDEIRSFVNYNNADVSWDGTGAGGNLVTNGTYFYVIEIPSIGLKESGWIQVVR